MKMNILLIVQVIAGLLLITFGLNKFLHFIAMPMPSVEMKMFMKALHETGYIFPIIAILEILSGLSFIVNKYTAFTVLLIIPVMLNAFLAHAFLDPSGIAASLFIMIALMAILFKNKSSYKMIFNNKEII